MFRKTVTVLVAFLILTTTNSGAAEKYSHTGPIFIQNVTVIDGRGTSPLLYRDVLVQNGKIELITVTGMDGTLPDGTKIIDGTGLTVMPGLMDLHVHLGAGVDHAKAKYTRDQIANSSISERP